MEFVNKTDVRLNVEKISSAKYVKADTPLALLSFCRGDVLIVKQHLHMEDALLIQDYPGAVTLVTTRPETLEKHDILKALRQKVELHLVEAIGLNSIHSGNTLFVFTENPLSAIPDIIALRPVERTKLEISVDIAAIEAAISSGKFETSPPVHAVPPGEEAAAETRRASAEELQLLRQEIIRRLNESARILHVNYPAAVPEKTVIPLLGLYEKLRISSRGLRRNWKAFPSRQKLPDLDIARRAAERLLEQYTVPLPGLGYLIRGEDVPALRRELERIPKDLLVYLRGGAVTSVGDEPVVRPFSPSVLQNTEQALREYLLEACHPADEGAKDRIERYVRASCRLLPGILAEKAAPSVSLSAFCEEQLMEPVFTEALTDALRQGKVFFDSELLRLIRRYERAGQIVESEVCL